MVIRTPGPIASSNIREFPLVDDPTPQLGCVLDTIASAIDESEGTAVESFAKTVIWVTNGNTVHVTGNTGPITSFGTAPRAGAVRWVIFDSTPTLDNSANLNLMGAANFTAAAGDFARVYADTTTQFDVLLFKADGTPVVSSITLATEQATTSGTAIDFTGIPAGTNRIIITFEGVSLSGTNALLVQIGDSGGIETAGYVSSGADIVAGANPAVVDDTTGFRIVIGAAGDIFSGHMMLTRSDATNFTWISSHFGKGSTSSAHVGGGDKSLSAELDRVRITRTGADTFDAGAVNIQHQL